MTIPKILEKLKNYADSVHTPIDDLKAVRQNDPFKSLIATMLSAQSQDKITAPVCAKLFENYATPQAFLTLSQEELEEKIFPITYYHTKAKHILQTCHILISKHDAKVPSTFSQLTSLPGVGPKTANVILGEVFQIPAMIVDTHAHRISNRLGIIRTKTREQSQIALEKALPKKEWVSYNNNIIKLGQTICTPRNPQCHSCPLQKLCPKIGVISQK
ncbi:MAG: endonuclease III domain-containing protein [Candidatus Woesearchaeota archaeon]